MVSYTVLLAGKTFLAVLASKAVYRYSRLGGYVPASVSAFAAGMMFVAILWALSGVNP